MCPHSAPAIALQSIAADYGVLLPDLGIALRGLFIINPEGGLEQITINGLPVGRSVDETLRLLAAYQFVAEHGEASTYVSTHTCICIYISMRP
jgi:alkyl hydroperoxide reductase subunit AhpC